MRRALAVLAATMADTLWLVTYRIAPAPAAPTPAPGPARPGATPSPSPSPNAIRPSLRATWTSGFGRLCAPSV